MKIKGIAYKFGDNINTDNIISGRYKFSITDIKELSKFAFEDIDPHFHRRIKKGKAIVVAGKNFGLGSSREQAPLVLKEAGVVAVVAKSFARIFFRNSFNIGLPLIEADTGFIKEKDNLEIDFDKGLLRNNSKKRKVKIAALPPFMAKLLSDGGILKHFKKYGRIDL